MTAPVPFSTPVAILGLGREGRAAWRYLRARHPTLAIDLLDESAPDPVFMSSLGPLDRLVCGPFDRAGLERYATLFRSPGISPYRDPIRRAALAGARVTGPGSLWFAAHPEARTICITGTKGKSTAAALLAHVLTAAGRKVRLAGNIGKALLEYEGEAPLQAPDWWVIELSSYQLTDLDARPTVGVILNFSPEHLDWHGGLETYRQDKFRLAELLGGNPLVLNAADPELAQRFGAREGVIWFNATDGFCESKGRLYESGIALETALPPGLPGAHNVANLAAVLTVVRCIGEDPQAALEAAADYRPLPHRLQLLGTNAGRRYVNDSISSTPVATRAALESYAGQTVVLIVGGYERGLDWRPYVETFAVLTPHAVIGVPENGPQILRILESAGIRPPAGMHQCPDLAAAVAEARKRTPRGGIVLLSPGAPSFPQFRDYRARGCRFAELCGLGFDDWEPF